jgi:ABC-type nickel/cobalt efflux system permease component RcnA
MLFTFPLLAGILASMLHVISGPDHLAAVSPLVIESKRKAWKIGLSWGLGHITGMLLIGVLFLFFKEYIPLEKISEYSEQLVGLVLIGVGFWAFYGIFKRKSIHKHPHIHSEEKPYIHIHKHEHNHLKSSHDHTHTKRTNQNTISSFGIGFLHGLAGVAHFFLLLPVLGFESNNDGIQYVLGFGIGTLLAMTAYAIVLNKLTSYSKQQHNEVFFKGIRLAGGLFAIIIGLFWILTTG